VADAAYAGEQIVGLQTAEDDVLRVEHIAKRFGPTIALRDINLHLRKGEVLALLGDNGAGKSTLIKILSGFQQPDRGTMWCKGEPYAPRSVQQARKAGIDTVYQDLALVGQLTVYQNMFLNRELVAKPLPLLINRAMRKRTRAALDDIGIHIPSIDLPVARLSGGQRQAIAVARVISGEPDIILLDEPLAAMGAKEGAQILDLVQRLRDSGNVSIILIVHNYVQVFQICDRVNLIQDGVITFDKPTSETSVDELNEIVVEQYRRARQEAQRAMAAEMRVDDQPGTGAASGSAREPGATADPSATADPDATSRPGTSDPGPGATNGPGTATNPATTDPASGDAPGTSDDPGKDPGTADPPPGG
jgi:simple sugar transport system ATP-binding protein